MCATSKRNFVGANSPRPALPATAIAIFRARDLMIPAISSRTFTGSNCLPDLLLVLLLAAFFAVFLLVVVFLSFPFFFIISATPDFLNLCYFPPKNGRARRVARPQQEVL